MRVGTAVRLLALALLNLSRRLRKDDAMAILKRNRSRTISKKARRFAVAMSAGAIVALLAAPIVAQTSTPVPSAGDQRGGTPIIEPVQTILDASFDNGDLGPDWQK